MTNRRLLGCAFVLLFAACTAAILMLPRPPPIPLGVVRLPGFLVYWAVDGDFESPGAFAATNWASVAFWAVLLLIPAYRLLVHVPKN